MSILIPNIVKKLKVAQEIQILVNMNLKNSLSCSKDIILINLEWFIYILPSSISRMFLFIPVLNPSIIFVIINRTSNSAQSCFHNSYLSVVSSPNFYFFCTFLKYKTLSWQTTFNKTNLKLIIRSFFKSNLRLSKTNS